MNLIPLIDCCSIPKEVEEYLSSEHHYECHCDHTVLQIENNGNVFAEWLKKQGYIFKSKTGEFPDYDLIALYGT